jgi:hypothetical protein
MAFRPSKKTHEPRPEELIASAAIDLSVPRDAKYFRNVVQAQRLLGRDPWKWFDEIGEVHYGVTRGSRVAGYAKIQAHKLEADGSIGEVITGGMEGEIAEQIASPYGGQRALTERFFTHMKIPGDTYLTRLRDHRDGSLDGYDFLDADEIDSAEMDATSSRDGGLRPGSMIRRITHPKLSNGELITQDIRAGDFLGRIWRPGPRYVDLADSPMKALEVNCELLHLLTIGLKAKMLSRLALNGIMYVPTEVNEIKSASMKAGTTNAPSNRVMDQLLTAATFAVLNYDQAEAAVPIFMTGPAQYADAIKHIVFDRQIYEVDMKLRAELIDRLLTGLDVQPNNVKGMGEANHWSAWAVEDDERRVNIQPDLETMCWALTRMVLHAEMIARGAKPGKVQKAVLWYDLTRANVKTNLAEDARQAYDRIIISDQGARRLNGIDESDAPSEAEKIRGFGMKHADPYLATYGLSEAKNIDWDKVGKGSSVPGPAGATPADQPKAGPGSTTGQRGKSESDKPARLRPA